MNGLTYSTLSKKYQEARKEIDKLEKENLKIRKENRKLKNELIDTSWLLWLKLDRRKKEGDK